MNILLYNSIVAVLIITLLFHYFLTRVFLLTPYSDQSLTKRIISRLHLKLTRTVTSGENTTPARKDTHVKSQATSTRTTVVTYVGQYFFIVRCSGSARQ